MNTKIEEIVGYIEQIAPREIQEQWDNCGVQVGDVKREIKGVLLCTDVTEATVDEAVAKGANLIMSHHPLIFGGLKRLTGATSVERIIMKAVKNDIVIYSAHTNMDKCWGGVSFAMAKRMGLKDVRVLVEDENALIKVVTYVPENQAEAVKTAMWKSGAGCIGEYDCCSFSSDGVGSFKAHEGCSPFVGKIGEIHLEPEVKVEMIVPLHMVDRVVEAIIKVHPYEEPAIDLLMTANRNPRIGLGCVGMLPEELSEIEALDMLKDIFGAKCVRHSALRGKGVKRVAMCGGSGADFIMKAREIGADLYVTGDIKYHDFALAENQIVIADIGHFESEQYTKEIFYEQLSKKFINFAICMADSDCNPVLYR